MTTLASPRPSSSQLSSSPVLFFAVAVCLAATSCSSGASAPTGTGGKGATAAGGMTATGTGGAALGTGGASGTGGVSGTGGAVGTGGSSTTGGASGSAGGNLGTGGTPTIGTGGGGGIGGSSVGGRGGNSSGGAPGAGGGSSFTGLTIVTTWPNGAIMTGVRDVDSPAVTDTMKIHNGGTSSLVVAGIALTGTGTYKAAFQIMGMVQVPTTLAPGADLPVTIQLMTSGSAIGPAPAQNDGGTLLTATLSVTVGSGAAQANVFGVLLTTATHEITLGQALTMLGYKLNVGKAQDNANPNTGSLPSTLPKVEAGTDEIAAPLFKKGPSGTPSLRAIARFSPKGPMPYGWYPQGSSGTRNMVATMASMPDAQTSDKARMMLPPLTGGPTFDPGTATFGIWVYTDQISQKYDTGGTATNGDYNFSEDGPNEPTNTHRTKVYPLKNAAGVVIPNSYLLAVEEAGNGDYQDYVFVLENVTVAN